MYSYEFRAVGYPVRIYSGKDALGNLPAELKRQGARRAFIVCGRTVSRRTPLIGRVRELLGQQCAGVFDEIDKDSTLASIQRARDAARETQADLIIAVGAGSVIQAARIVVILLAETRPIGELVTQYPENAPAVSPRLDAPKLPIINVLTAPTTAQNRGGSGAKDQGSDHRLEFFDPKTRPAAIFWDADALLTAPLSLARTTAVSVFWRAAMNLGATGMTPLVEGDRLQAFRLARHALKRVTDPRDPGPRLELCAAALLQNREADDGGSMFAKHWAARVTYAFATALFNIHPEVGQGEASSALTGTVMRALGSRNLPEMVRIARALDVWDDDLAAERTPQLAADALDAVFRGIGMPTRVGELGTPPESAERILAHALKNFNADPKREFARERDGLLALLRSCW
ncbi:MAG: iron-containing alcohol dehydrogenase family protein [Betaproteobacteria bacterium]|nr:iron-containing alcohol dehydrogenase family protein [Betaproteobacteria bacterium]